MLRRMSRPPSRNPALAPATARRCWGVLEPLHVVVYLTARPRAALAQLGLVGPASYVAQRSAPLGRVPAKTVEALFYVFAPRMIETVTGAWEVTTPEQVIEARYAAVAQTLDEMLAGADLSTVPELVELARTACSGLSAPGRPLYGAHASLPWPEAPLMQLWHAAVLLREHRGDGHMTALLHGGFDPVEALVTDGVTAGNYEFGRTMRGWTDGEWAAGLDRMRGRGWLQTVDGRHRLTEAGQQAKAGVEAATDRAGLSGWAALGEDGCARFVELLLPLRSAIRHSGALPEWLFGR